MDKLSNRDDEYTDNRGGVAGRARVAAGISGAGVGCATRAGEAPERDEQNGAWRIQVR